MLMLEYYASKPLPKSVALLIEIAIKLEKDGKKEEVAQMLRKAAIEAELHNTDTQYTVNLWRDSGHFFYLSFNFTEGIKAFDNALVISQKDSDKIGEYRIRLQIVNILHAAGDYHNSLEEIHSAFNIAEELQNQELLTIAKSFLGAYYSYTKEADLALKYQMDVIRHFEATNDKRKIAGAYYNAARAYVIALDAKNAEYYFRKALSYYKETNAVEDIMRCKCILGGVLGGYYMNGVGTNPGEGYLLLKEALELSVVHGYKYDEFGQRLILAQMYEYDNNDVLAEKEYLVVKELALQGGSQQNSLEYNKKLSEIAERKGDFTQALDYLKQHISVLEKDEITKQKQRQTIFEIQINRIEEKRKNELLENELRSKQRVNEAVNLHVQENEKFLLELHKRLEKIEITTNKNTKKQILPLRKEIKDTLGLKKGWFEFEQGFIGAHTELAQKLSTKFPSLTQTEHKICLLLHAGRSTKEIASLLHISPDTVDTHRINIRRKMNLQPRTSIRTVLASL